MNVEQNQAWTSDDSNELTYRVYEAAELKNAPLRKPHVPSRTRLPELRARVLDATQILRWAGACGLLSAYLVLSATLATVGLGH